MSLFLEGRNFFSFFLSSFFSLSLSPSFSLAIVPSFLARILACLFWDGGWIFVERGWDEFKGRSCCTC